MKLYKITEVAEALQTSARTVRRLIGAGELRAVNVSTGVQPRWRVTEGQLRKFLAERRSR